MGGEGQVFAQRHVREQRVVLEDVAAGALLRRQVHAGFGVEEDAVVKKDAAGVGPDETGDGIEGEGFAGAAGSVERGDASGGLKLDFEVEAGGFRPRSGCFLTMLAWIIVPGVVPDDWP